MRESIPSERDFLVQLYCPMWGIHTIIDNKAPVSKLEMFLNKTKHLKQQFNYV